jgi:chromosome segregation ATPase
MKIKIAIIVLAVACIGLAVALFAIKKQGEEQHNNDLSSINEFSNQVVSANVQLKDLGQANLALTNDLALSRQEAMELSNSLAAANIVLATDQTNLATAQEVITNLTYRVSDLEEQNKMLDQRATELTNIIAQLNLSISNTLDKLAISETNTAFLQGELQKQMTQKAELEHKFNDVNEVRAQVKKLKDEIFIAHRAELSRNDNGSRKGAEMLTPRYVSSATNASRLPPNYDLNVEVGSDGSVKIIPPLGVTNAPAH